MRHDCSEVKLYAPDPEAMQSFGIAIARLLQPGDVLIATGALGAGKTTLAQGIGAGLGVQGNIVSPTFVISRIHPSLASGPPFVHVDAYRLSDAAELEDLDLEETLAESVTLIEWGEGKAELLSDQRLEIVIERSNNPEDDTRILTLSGVGSRWCNAGLEELAQVRA